MIRLAGRGRHSEPRRFRQAMSPTLEGLEDRRLLSSLNGGQWYYPIRITYSFMPDGTSIGGVPSNLFQKMNAVAPTAVWQQAFQKAAAIWQQVTGINLAQVSDNGDPVGGAGYQQGDPRYGDIRIGGTAMSSGTLAYALSPPPINGGSDAGDIVISTSANWQINNDYDLQTVALHEFGHALGLGHSATTAADMYAYYTSMKQSLNSDDTAGIQRIYGPASSDPTANTTMSTAIDLTPLINGSNQIAYGAGYVTNVQDYEWYKFTVPATVANPLTVKMQTNDLSSLAPRLAMFNSAGASLGQAIDVNRYGSTVTMTIANPTPGQVYYIRASAANPGAGSNGAFGLLVNFTTNPQAPITPPNTQRAAQADQGTTLSPETTQGRIHRHAHATHHRPATGKQNDDNTVVIKLGRGRRAVGDALKVSPSVEARDVQFRTALRKLTMLTRRGW